MAKPAQVQLIEQVCQLIETHLDEPLTLADLGAAVERSPAHLQRLFKRLMGISPRQYLQAKRFDHFKRYLREENSVTKSVYEAGFGSPSPVYECAAQQLGMTPACYRARGRHACIRYTLTDCALGRLLLAGTDCGVSAIYFGDEDDPLVAELRWEFAAARLWRDEAGLAAWTQRVQMHLVGAEPHLDLPLEVRATAFQRRVWQELQRIPRGQTRTYRQVAEALDQPTAARAVARACATNPVSVVVPCHRVVRGDGGLGGYRWGLARKRRLLAQEAKPTEPSS